MRGFKPQRKQEQQSEPEQQPQQQQPEPTQDQPTDPKKKKKRSVPKKRVNAITEYAGGYETARRLEAMGLKDGGLVVGPGTGTSDDIPTNSREGSYIMPADSTQEIGPEKLAGLGAPVPVNLSNGEYELPPEQVHALGVQMLEQIKDATHTPTEDAENRPQHFFADGGEVRRLRNDRPRNTRVGAPRLPGPQPQAAPPAMLAQPTQAGAGAAGPAPGAAPRGFQEPNWRGRAEQMHRVKRDTANFEAERARQDARFSQAQADQQTRQAATESNTNRTRPAANARGARQTVGRVARGTGLVTGAMALQDMSESGINARNATELGVGLASSNAVRGSVARAAPVAGRALGVASPVGAVAASGYGGYQYGSNLQGRMEEGRPLNRLEAGLGFIGSRLGEGYARYAPTWLGGMDRETARYAPEMTTMSDLRAGSGEPAQPAAGGRAQSSVAQELAASSAQEPTAPAQSSGQMASGPAGPAPQSGPAGPQMDNNVIRDGNSFSATGPVREGFTVNGEDPGLAPGTIRNLDGGPETAPQYAPAMPTAPARGFSGGGGPQVSFLRDSSQAERERISALNAASRRYRGAHGLTRAQLQARNELINMPRQEEAETRREQMALQREQMSQAGADRRADARNAIDWARLEGDAEQRGFASRSARRLESLHERYEQAETAEERSEIARAIRDIQGQSRPPFQVATTEDLIDPQNPMMGTRRMAYVIDPATGQGRPITGGEQQGAQFQEGQVYVDGSGNLARWDGQQFVPVE